MHTHTIQTADGHTVDANCWKGRNLNFQIHIDGELFDQGSTFTVDTDDDPEAEARTQAEQTAEAIPFRFVATYHGETLGYFDTAEEAEAAIDAARAEEEEQ